MIPFDDALLVDVQQLIDAARQRAAVSVNAELTMLHWQVGQRINRDVLQDARAEYGAQVIKRLAEFLMVRYGRGWGEKQLRQCLRFAEVFADEAIVYALSRQFSWTQLRTVMSIQDDLKRDFYLEMTRLEGWSSRDMRERIQSMLYERTAISRKPAETVQHDLEQLRSEGKVSPELLLKDSYLLNFLDLQDRYLEKDLEDAILRNLERFLLEMGAGFTFVARQKRIQIDDDDFYIDLLLYNRKLKRLVVIDLKIGEFKAEFKGQMELYLRWLERHESEPGEATPLGIILETCCVIRSDRAKSEHVHRRPTPKTTRSVSTPHRSHTRGIRHYR
jgi:predicted nuclease of restriction endonuclease-like (RecB) superfamily